MPTLTALNPAELADVVANAATIRDAVASYVRIGRLVGAYSAGVEYRRHAPRHHRSIVDTVRKFRRWLAWSAAHDVDLLTPLRSQFSAPMIPRDGAHIGPWVRSHGPGAYAQSITFRARAAHVVAVCRGNDS